MSKELQIQLQPSSILNVPLQIYEQNFTFIVNGEEFKTSQLISDLLSPTICSAHETDPTNDTFLINTKEQGHFSYILNLASFRQVQVPVNEIPFFTEVLSILKNDNIKIYNIEHNEITEDNVINLLKEHMKCPYLYNSNIDEEIDFISTNFYKLCETQSEYLKNLEESTLIRIISNDKLHLQDENQLLHFLNERYENLKESNLYEFVIFENVDVNTIEEFICIFDYNELTTETWQSITNRLKQQISMNLGESKSTRYERKNRNRTQNTDSQNERQCQIFSPQNKDRFDGIVNFLKRESNGNIESKISITTSSYNASHLPINTINYDDSSKWFRINTPQSSDWLCFEFKTNQIIPTDYQIKSIPYGTNSNHLKSWILEGSNDNSQWDILDEQTNCNYLNGNCFTRIFNISNPSSKKFKFIRIRLNGNDWGNANYLMLGSIEFYGALI